jgi:hypothetical protein
MSINLHDSFERLINAISELENVFSIGKSGVGDIPLHNESDIDVFVFCDKIPAAPLRHSVVRESGIIADKSEFGEASVRFWGICDFITVCGTEICLMYFTVSEMDKEIDSVLNCSRLDREDEYFYPTGRCASFINMCIFYDKYGYINGKKEKLKLYPEELSERLFNHHSNRINDAEDFNRAVIREDALFYHSTFESAIDHFLQALFALNKVFFPSRKRTIQFINDFKYKPRNCSDRLLEVIALGSNPKTLYQSYYLWNALCNELIEVSKIYFHV